MSEIAASTPTNPVLHEQLDQRAASDVQFVTGSACTDKIEIDSTAAPLDVSYRGSSVSSTIREMNDRNDTRANVVEPRAPVDNLPSEQVHVASFAHQSAVQAQTSAGQSAVNFQQSVSDMTYIESNAAIGQEAYTESPPIYLPGSSKQLKGN